MDNLNYTATSWSELSIRDRIAYVVTSAAFVVGASLSIIGLIIPPVGEVHPSVITLVGLFLSFCGALLGISHHFNNELERFKSEILKMEEQRKNEVL